MADLRLKTHDSITTIHDAVTGHPLDWERFELTGIRGEIPYLVVGLKGGKRREGRASVDVEMKGAVVEPEESH